MQAIYYYYYYYYYYYFIIIIIIIIIFIIIITIIVQLLLESPTKCQLRLSSQVDPSLLTSRGSHRPDGTRAAQTSLLPGGGGGVVGVGGWWGWESGDCGTDL